MVEVQRPGGDPKRWQATAQESFATAHGRPYWIKFCCQPSRPDDEPEVGEGEFVYRGADDQWGKLEFRCPGRRGLTIWLFPYEITDGYLS